MDIRALICFVAVAEQLHFGRASEQVHLTQPALSQRIRALEKEVGVALFERSRRNVHLTPAGLAFLAPARRAIEQVTLAKELALRAERGDIGDLRLGFTAIAFHEGLANVLRLFRQKRPDVAVQIEEMTSPRLEAALATGEIDLGILHPPLETPGLCTRPVRDVRFRLALRADHHLAKQPSVMLSQLADEPFLMGSRKIGPRIHDRIIAWFRNEGISPRVVQEVTPVISLLGFVEEGVGMGLVTEGLTARSWPGIAFRDVDPEPPRLPQVVAWRSPGLLPAGERFLEELANMQPT